MEAERKSGIDKAEIAFKVKLLEAVISVFEAIKQSKHSITLIQPGLSSYDFMRKLRSR